MVGLITLGEVAERLRCTPPSALASAAPMNGLRTSRCSATAELLISLVRLLTVCFSPPLCVRSRTGGPRSA